MKEARNYLWVAPLIAGILTLISFFTPAVYANLYGIQENYWMWGLASVNVTGYGSQTFLIPLEQPTAYTVPMFLTGFFPAIVIFISSILFIYMANAVRNGRKTAKDLANVWIGMGITIIIGTIIYIIGIDITMINYIEYMLGYPISMSIWDYYSPGFAVIAPFIAAALSIIGGIASKTLKTREVILSMKKEFPMAPEKVFNQPSEEITFKFCPNCGYKIVNPNNKFCTNCGFEINP
jgi:hypothetical protein